MAVGNVPPIGPSESKRELKAKLLDLFGSLAEVRPDDLSNEGIELTLQLRKGDVDMRLFSASTFKHEDEYKQARSIYGPMVGGLDDSVGRIIRALKMKRRQVRAASASVILALAGGAFGGKIEDLDQALIGHSYEEVVSMADLDSPRKTGFTRDGVL